VTHSCLDTLGALACSDKDIAYFFWDDIHPTTLGHELIGQNLVAAVPLPASALLLLSGLASLTGWFLHGKKKAAQSARPV
jgi:phospholipase/lecithinase/hemolysin